MIEDDEDMGKVTAEWSAKLLGLHHTFEDGDSIEVIQVRRRDVHQRRDLVNFILRG